MKDRLLTVVISVATTIAVMSFYDRPQPAQALAAQAGASPAKELVVDRLVVRHELIVSDTGEPWEKGFEKQEIARGLYAKSTGGGVGAAGLWVRGRLIKTELDDPFDDRFHAMNRDGTMFRAPGHISWNVWLGDHWRQLAIIQGETLENNEVPLEKWSGGNHPGRLRFQSFRPNHDEPLTDATIGQGKMSLGGGGYGGGGLPYAKEVLQLWGGKVSENPIATPKPPRVTKHEGAGPHSYAVIAVGPQGQRSQPSPAVKTEGLATLQWDSVAGADAYVVLRDGQPATADVLRIEGSQKNWTDSKR